MGPPVNPPPSPTRQKLCSPKEVVEQLKKWIVPGSVGRVAIKLYLYLPTSKPEKCFIRPMKQNFELYETENNKF